VGKFAFGGIVSLLLVVGISWQAPVIGFGVCGILTAVAIWVLVVDTGAGRPQVATGQTKPAAAAAGWDIRDSRGFTALCLIEILDSSTRTGFLTFIAFVLIAKGLPEAWAVLSVPLILIGGMAGKLACGYLAERFGVVRMIVITEIATGCGILATLALPAAASFLLLPLVGIVLNGTSSVLYATIGDYVEKDRLARAFGFFYTLGSLCGIAAPLGYGLVGDLYGIETAIGIVGVAIFLTVPLAALLKPGAAARLKSA
jgi:MFS transporter, FSR family, fosmidomycin resistance protein